MFSVWPIQIVAPSVPSDLFRKIAPVYSASSTGILLNSLSNLPSQHRQCVQLFMKCSWTSRSIASFYEGFRLSKSWTVSPVTAANKDIRCSWTRLSLRRKIYWKRIFTFLHTEPVPDRGGQFAVERTGEATVFYILLQIFLLHVPSVSHSIFISRSVATEWGLVRRKGCVQLVHYQINPK